MAILSMFINPLLLFAAWALIMAVIITLYIIFELPQENKLRQALFNYYCKVIMFWEKNKL